MVVRVKICGLVRREDVEASVDAGADAVGFIHGFPASPRNLSPEALRKLLRLPPAHVERVVVSPAGSHAFLRTVAEEFRPDALQLYGNLSLLKETTGLPKLIGAFHVENGSIPSMRGMDLLDSVLLDSAPGETPGGTGRVHSWEVSRRIREEIYPKPLILSGGLNSSNVAEAIQAVKPHGVDASSGLEYAPGKKDHRKILDFVTRAKESKADE